MLKPNLRNSFLLLSTVWVFACSHIGIQSAGEGITTDLIPDCQRNCTKEGGLLFGAVYKTWVKYDHLDFTSGFDFAVRTLRSHGH